jgi:radical SAM mobile pair protein B
MGQLPDTSDIAVREVEARGILTRSNLPVCEYSVNPYLGCTHGCRYCYASFMKRFSNHPEPWGEFLDVKHWPDIKNPSRYRGRELFVGSVTDPYLPQEETFRRTRELLEQLQGSGAKLSIQTKSDLVLRDLDLIKTFPDARVGLSINTLDESFRVDMDRAVSIERRLAAMERLHDAGVRTTCFISPIFPGITDPIAIIERVSGICNLVWLENLNLRGSFKPDVMGYIATSRPELASLYQDIYAHNSRDYWEDLDAEIRDYAGEKELDYVRDDDTTSKPFDAPPTIVNFFYHEEIKKSAKRGASLA